MKAVFSVTLAIDISTMSLNSKTPILNIKDPAIGPKVSTFTVIAPCHLNMCCTSITYSILKKIRKKR